MTQNISFFSDWHGQEKSAIAIGNDATNTGKQIFTTQEDLESGTYVLGVQGVGKSSLLLDMILQQMKVGESVIALDPHGDLVRDVIARMPSSRMQDTYLFDLKEARKWPFGLNIFALPPDRVNSPEARDSVRNQVMHAFEKLWPETRTGLYFGNVLRPVISTLIENQELTLAHVPRLFYNDAFREHFTKQLKNPEAQDFWGEYSFWSHSKRERYIDPLLDRVKKLLSDDSIRFILCQKQAKLDLADLIKQRKNILLRLPLRDPAYEYAAPIIGTFFITLLQAAIFSFGNMPNAKRPACTLVIDEFQNFVTMDNERFFSEGRKYKVKQILAHQYMSQLDRDGLTTMKAAVTSAHTIITFRTNKDDSAAMANVFNGLQRKPIHIYIDVLSHLDDAKNPALVKEFYWNTVRPLQLAAKLHEDRKTGELPSSDFGLGNTAFEPALVTATSNSLNDVLYFAQKDGYVNERLFQTFWNNFLLLNKDVVYLDVEDTGNMRKIRELDEKIARLIEISEGNFPPEEKRKIIDRFIKQAASIEQDKIKEGLADEESLASLEQKVARCIEDFALPLWESRSSYVVNEALEEIQIAQQWKMAKVYLKRNQQFHDFLANHPLSEMACQKAAHDLGVDTDIGILEGREGKEFLSSRADIGKGIYKRLYVPYDIKNGILQYTEVKEFTRLFQERRIIHWIQIHYRGFVCDSMYEAMVAIKELEEIKGTISPTRKVENSRVRDHKKLVQRVVDTLIAHPLTADSSSFSSAEIATMLQQQPNRQAYVKIASAIYTMNTRDVSEQFTPVSWNDTDERRNTLLSQTRRAYCQGRATIEREIAEVYEQILSKQEEINKLERLEPEKKVVSPRLLIATHSLHSLQESRYVPDEGEIIEPVKALKQQINRNAAPLQNTKETANPPKVAKSVDKQIQPQDVFDMLDAHESTE